MASIAVDLAAAKGMGPSSELEQSLVSFIQKHGQQDFSEMAAATTPQSLSNPPLQKKQRQARLQPFAGPTTKAAAQQSRKNRAAKKKEKEAKEAQKTADFLK
jgi:hypothetical protein